MIKDTVTAEIRAAKGREDAEKIAALARIVWSEHYTPIIGMDQVNYMLGKFQSKEKIYEDIVSGGYTYYLACIDARPVGYCAAKPGDGSRLFLSKLYVAQEARGKGLARRFLELLESRCSAEGFNSIYLTVNKNNTGSIEAYKRLGFSLCESVVTDIGGGYVMDDYVFVKKLNG